MGDAKESRQSQGAGDKGCFICDGPHFAKNCPRRERLNALCVEEQSEGNNEENEGVAVRANPIRLVTLRTEKSVEGDGLMYVKALVNGKTVMAMVDTGATNSFLSERCVGDLGLKMAPSELQIRMANAEVQQIRGTSNVGLTVGEWQGNFTFNIVALDDFDCILGMDFLLMTRTAVIAHLGGIMMENGGWPFFVKAVPMRVDKGKQKSGILGATRVLVGNVDCAIQPEDGKPFQLGGTLQKFLQRPKSLSPKVGDSVGT